MIRSTRVRVRKAECNVYGSGDFPPSTTVTIGACTWVSIDGPDRDGDIQIVIDECSDVASVFVPVALLANHLRQAGWTVTPPSEVTP